MKATTGLPLELVRALSGRPLLLDSLSLDALIVGSRGAALQLAPGLPEDSSSGYCVCEGVAVIPMMGVFLKRGTGLDWLDQLFGIVSVEELGETIQAAVADPAVRSLLFQIDSGGGESRGVFDLADMIYGLRGQKPMVAVADEWAFSAAYLVASAADQVVMPRTGGVGSIGVYATRLDVTQADANLGIRVDVVKFGDHKTDGNSHVPATDAELADIQAQVDAIGNLFVDTVARNRGLTRQSVIDQQARAYGADDALRLGLVDDIETFSDAVMELATAPNIGTGGIAMAEDTGTTPGAAASNVVDFAAEKARLEAAARDAGRVEERERLETITNQCVAAGRPDLIASYARNKDATPATVARELASQRVAADEAEAITGLPTVRNQDGVGTRESLNPETVYARRREDVRRAAAQRGL